jgi:hypothetical protein
VENRNALGILNRQMLRDHLWRKCHLPELADELGPAPVNEENVVVACHQFIVEIHGRTVARRTAALIQKFACRATNVEHQWYASAFNRQGMTNAASLSCAFSLLAVRGANKISHRQTHNNHRLMSELERKDGTVLLGPFGEPNIK